MKSVIVGFLKSAPKFLANSSVNLHVEGWPAAVSVCGFSGAMVAIAYMVKQELEQRRLSDGDKSASEDLDSLPLGEKNTSDDSLK